MQSFIQTYNLPAKLTNYQLVKLYTWLHNLIKYNMTLTNQSQHQNKNPT